MKKIITYGLLIALILILLSPFASSYPDGLEKVSEIFNFSDRGINLISSPLPDYTVPFIKNLHLSLIVGGVIGILIVFILLYLLGTLLKKKID